MSDLTENQRGQIIGIYKSGASYRSISKTLGFPTTTVFRTVKNFEERDSMANLPRSGCPKILNSDHKKSLKILLNVTTINQLNK